jgi:two-component system, chemotaxis family, sensor kinase CheA
VPEAVEEAFRAAHTLKGISAAMGFAAVAEQAHALEDRLEEVRRGAARPDGACVDALLAAADRLEAAVAASVAGGAPVPTPPAASPAAADTPPPSYPRRPTPTDAAPHGTAFVATVRLRPDAALPAVRAMLVLRALHDLPALLGSDPATLDDSFAGSLRIFLGAAADRAAVRAAAENAGDVESVEIVAVGEPGAEPGAAVVAAKAAAGGAPARIRVDAARLDEVAEAAAELAVLFGRLGPRADDAATEALDRMGAVLTGLQQTVLELRMAPVGVALERLPRVVRDAARSVGRDVALEVSGGDVELDRAIIDALGEPLVHLLRNAVDHGIEDAEDRVRAGKQARGHVRVRAERERSSVCITVSDDGRGVDAGRVLERAAAAGLDVPRGATAGHVGDEELFRLLSHPGLSTAGAVSDVSGRGVGLDVVVSRVRALGGAISMHSVPGAGTTFTVRLPITLALMQALHVRVGAEDYVVPLTHVAEVIELNGDVTARTLEVRGEAIRIVHLGQVLQTERQGHERMAIVAGIGERRAALAVDELVGREQILVKGFAGVAGMLPCFSGATLLGDGRPALVLDPLSVI